MDTVTLAGNVGLVGQRLAFEGTSVVATFVNPDYPTPNAFNVGSTFDWTIGTRTLQLNGLQYAAAESYVTPGQADVGKAISVAARVPYFGADHIGVDHTATSQYSLTVVNVNDLPTGTLTIAGDTHTAGSRLQAVSTIADEDGLGTLSYQWQADGKDIAGATTATLVLGQSDAGKTITVVARYVDGFGEAERVASDADPKAVHADTRGTVDIAGTLAAGQTLRATVHDPDDIGKVYYQWQTGNADGHYADVAGAWSRDFTVGTGVPAVVRVLTTYADHYGTIDSQATTLGTDGADVIGTDYQYETVFAGAGDDTIRDDGTGDTIDGGAGLDTVVSGRFSGPLKPAGTVPNTWVYYDIVNGNPTTLTNVERILVANGTAGIALDVDGHAGQAYRLYHAAFDREPDQVGIGFWMSRLDKGMDLTAVADAFVASDEFKTLYGANPGNADIVARFYEHVLHRAPDAESRFWVDVLDHKAATVAQVLAGFSESAENVAALVGVAQQGIAFTPYTGA